MTDNIIVTPPAPITVSVNPVTGAKGDQGNAGPQGPSGVIDVTSPITNSGSTTAANIGINQSLLSIASTQITGTLSPSQITGTAAVLNVANTFTATQTVPTLSASKVTITGTASADTDAVTKAYADTIASGMNAHDAVSYATTGPLTATYNNGTAGVGATLTNAGAQAVLAIDGYTFQASDVTNSTRVLIKDQANAKTNGIYTVTDIGSGSTNWVLTRATDNDHTPELGAGDFAYVLNGNINGKFTYIQTTKVTSIDPTTGSNITWTVLSNGNFGSVVAVNQGGTGATTASAALTNLGAASLTADNNFTGLQTFTQNLLSSGVIRATSLAASDTPTSSIVSNFTTGHVVLKSVTTAPATAVGGGTIYVDTGALKYRGTSGSAATLANADGTNPLLSSANTFTAAQTINLASTAVGLVVRGASPQSNDLQRWQSYDGTNNITLAKFDNSANLYVGNRTFLGTLNYIGNYGLYSTPKVADELGVVFRGLSSQVNDIFEIQNSSAVPLTQFSADGSLIIGEEATTNLVVNPSFEVDATATGSNGTSAIARTTEAGAFSGSNSLRATATGGATFAIYPTTTGGGRLAVTGQAVYSFSYYVKAGTHTGNFQANIEWYTSGNVFISTTSGTSTAIAAGYWTRITITATAPSNAALATPTAYSSTNGAAGATVYFDALQFEQKPYPTSYVDGSVPGGSWTGTANASTSTRAALTRNAGGMGLSVGGTGYFLPQTASTVGLVVRSLSNQTADLQQWQNSSGVTNSRIGSDGIFRGTLSDSTQVGSFLSQPYAITQVPITSRGMSGQTADLQRWQTFDGTTATTVAQVSSAGAFTISPSAGTALTVNAAGTSSPVILAKGGSSQSFNDAIFRVASSADANYFRIMGNGAALFDNTNIVVNLGSVPSTNPRITAWTGYAAGQGMLIRGYGTGGAVTQTGDLMVYQQSTANTGSDASSTTIGGRNALAQIYSGSTAPITTAVGGTIQSIATGANPLVTLASNHSLNNGAIVTLAGTTGGTYDGTFVISNASNNTFNITTALTTGQAAAAGTVSVPAQASILARDSGTKGLVVRGAASAATGNSIFEVQYNNSTNVGLGVNIYGNTYTGNGFSSYGVQGFGASGTVGNANASANFLSQGNATALGVAIAQASANQVGDLQQFLTSTPFTPMAGFNAVGQMYLGSTQPVLAPIAYSIISGSGTSVSVTTNSNHNLSTGDIVYLSGFTPTSYNNTALVTAGSGTSLTLRTQGTGAITVNGTISAPAQASVTARSAGTVGLVVRGASNQAAVLQSWVTSSWDGTNGRVAYITNGGTFEAATIQAASNLRVASPSAGLGGGAGVIGIANASTIPTSTTSAGVILYANNGALSFTGTSLPNGGATGTNVAILNSDGTQGNAPISITSTTGTTYTLGLTDAGKNIEMNTTSTNTVSIPTDATTNFPIGTQITVVQTNTGATTISAATPGTTTVNFFSPTSAANATLKGRWAAATVIKRGANAWVVIGNLT